MHIKRRKLQIVAIIRCIYLGSGDEWLVVYKELKQKRKNKKRRHHYNSVVGKIQQCLLYHRQPEKELQINNKQQGI